MEFMEAEGGMFNLWFLFCFVFISAASVAYFSLF